jgi:hypothetical protein
MFEFSKFYPSDFAHNRDFVAARDQFLGQLPQGRRCGGEIRNKNSLHPDYFAMLRQHGVAHNTSWGRMPSVGEQLAMPDSRTTSEFVGARFLLKPGRKYQEAVGLFSPYDRIKEPNDEAREAGKEMIKQAVATKPEGGVFIYVEGNPLRTIEAIMNRAK